VFHPHRSTFVRACEGIQPEERQISDVLLVLGLAMHSSASSLKLSGGGPSEPLTRLGCIRQCQETVQELVIKPMEVCAWLQQFLRAPSQYNNLTQQQAQNLADKRARFEASLDDITIQFNSLRHLFVRLREIHEYVRTRESTAATATNSTELSRLLKQKSIYEEIVREKQNQLKITIDTIRDITYQINTMIDLRHDGTMNTLMNNTNTQEK
jgi:Mediator complex subunit 30